jgi:hypothetical protein
LSTRCNPRDRVASLIGPALPPTLHQLRHSALTHAAEDGTNLPLLLARSRHASVRSLERYAHPGPEAVAVTSPTPTRHVGGHDPLPHHISRPALVNLIPRGWAYLPG